MEKLCKKHGLTEFSLRNDGKYRCKKCSVDSVTLKRKRNKLYLVEYKGGKCEICGYNKCIEVLEFHHLNPEEKEVKIGSGNIKSLSKLKEEVDKCVLVCANCHREIHSKINQENAENYKFEIEQNKEKFSFVSSKKIEVDKYDFLCDIKNKMTQKDMAIKYNASISTIKRIKKNIK